jgi:hypothetical protein
MNMMSHLRLRAVPNIASMRPNNTSSRYLSTSVKKVYKKQSNDTRSKSKKKSSSFLGRLVVKDSRSLATAMVKLIDDSDIYDYRKSLQTLRENPQTKGQVITNLSNKKCNTVAWWNKWLIKALSNQRANLFPYSIPVADGEGLMKQKAKLAALLFATRHIVPTPFRDFLLSDNMKKTVAPSFVEEKSYRKASILANELGNRLPVPKLELLNEILRCKALGEMDDDALVDEITKHCNLHLDFLAEFFRFLDIPLTPIYKQLINSRQKQREATIDRLASEIGHLVYTHSGLDSTLPSNASYERNVYGQGASKRKPYISFSCFNCLEIKLKCYAKHANVSVNKYFFESSGQSANEEEEEEMSPHVNPHVFNNLAMKRPPPTALDVLNMRNPNPSHGSVASGQVVAPDPIQGGKQAVVRVLSAMPCAVQCCCHDCAYCRRGGDPIGAELVGFYLISNHAR